MLEVALRASAILIVAWGITRLMPRATAAMRHLVWHAAIVGVVLAPALAPIAPSLPLIPSGFNLQPLPSGSRLQASGSRVQAPGTRGSQASGPEASAHQASAGHGSDLGAMLPVDLTTVGTIGALGSLSIAVWCAFGWIAVARLRRRTRPAPSAWQLEVNTLCQRLGIDREVSVGLIEAHTSPLATGLLRPAILLPPTAAAWSTDRRRAVLIHELAHIKRRDCRVQLVVQIACAMYWFNPVVWLAASELRTERERACDDEVLRLGAQPSSYAAHLLDIARELKPTVRPSAALAMARPRELEGRLLAVLAAGRARVPRRGTRWGVMALLAVTTVTALGASARQSRDETVTGSTRIPYVVANDVALQSQPSPVPRSAAESTLEHAADPRDRELATLALAFTSGLDVIPALLQALNDPDSQVREKAAIGLALRRDARVVEPLIAAMSDADAQVREKVAIALGTSGDPRAKAALTRALDDPDSQVREKAVAGLMLFGVTQ